MNIAQKTYKCFPKYNYTLTYDDVDMSCEKAKHAEQ